MATFRVLKLRNGQQEGVKILHKGESLAKYVSEVFSPVEDYKTEDISTQLNFGGGALRQRFAKRHKNGDLVEVCVFC